MLTTSPDALNVIDFTDPADPRTIASVALDTRDNRIGDASFLTATEINGRASLLLSIYDVSDNVGIFW